MVLTNRCIFNIALWTILLFCIIKNTSSISLQEKNNILEAEQEFIIDGCVSTTIIGGETFTIDLECASTYSVDPSGNIVPTTPTISSTSHSTTTSESNSDVSIDEDTLTIDESESSTYSEDSSGNTITTTPTISSTSTSTTTSESNSDVSIDEDTLTIDVSESSTYSVDSSGNTITTTPTIYSTSTSTTTSESNSDVSIDENTLTSDVSESSTYSEDPSGTTITTTPTISSTSTSTTTSASNSDVSITISDENTLTIDASESSTYSEDPSGTTVTTTPTISSTSTSTTISASNNDVSTTINDENTITIDISESSTYSEDPSGTTITTTPTSTNTRTSESNGDVSTTINDENTITIDISETSTNSVDASGNTITNIPTIIPTSTSTVTSGSNGGVSSTIINGETFTIIVSGSLTYSVDPNGHTISTIPSILPTSTNTHQTYTTVTNSQTYTVHVDGSSSYYLDSNGHTVSTLFGPTSTISISDISVYTTSSILDGQTYTVYSDGIPTYYIDSNGVTISTTSVGSDTTKTTTINGQTYTIIVEKGTSYLIDSQGATITSTPPLDTSNTFSSTSFSGGVTTTDYDGLITTTTTSLTSPTMTATQTTNIGSNGTGNQSGDEPGSSPSGANTNVSIYINSSYDTEFHDLLINYTSCYMTNKYSKKCPFLTNKPFTQKAVRPVKTIGYSLTWDINRNLLYIVDQYGQQVLAYDPITGKIVTLTIMAQSMQGFLPTSIPNQFILQADNSIVMIQNLIIKDSLIVKYKKIFTIFDPVYSVTTCKSDLQGRIWIALSSKKYCNSTQVYFTLYMISNGKAVIRETNLQSISSLAWSKDSKQLYIVDNKQGMIFAYSFQESTGDISNPVCIFEMTNYPHLSGKPFAIAVDNHGYIWISLYFGFAIIKVSVNTGTIEQIIPMSTACPVSLTFGGTNLDMLFVSSCYQEYIALNVPITYVVSNTGTKGVNSIKTINTMEVFSSKTMNIKVKGYKECASPFNNPNSTVDASHYSCTISPDLIKFRKKSLLACGFLTNKAIMQQAIIPIKTLGLSLHYDHESGSIYFVDTFEPALIKYNIHSGKSVIINLEGVTSVATLIPVHKNNNYYIVAQDHQLTLFKNSFKSSGIVYRPYTKILTKIHTADPKIVFSNGKVDKKGRLWIGTKYATKEKNRNCKLYVLTKNVLKEAAGNISASGGMAFANNNKDLYLADSGDGIIYMYKFDLETGEISQRREFFSIKKENRFKGTISDITTDNEGYIWATVYGNGMVVRIDAFSGRIDNIIGLPMKYPTSLEFAGSKRDVLFVTSNQGNATVDSLAYTISISNLGVTAGANETYKFVLDENQ